MVNLREIRLSRGLSVSALSKISDVPVRTIEDIEARGDCRLSTMLKLANALNVTIDDFVVRNRIFASTEPDFDKAARLNPPFRTPSKVFTAKHFIDAAEALEKEYKDTYPQIFESNNIYYFCIDERGMPKRFDFGSSYRDDSTKASE